MKVRPDNTHWREQPRHAGQFGTVGESPSYKTPVSFKVPEAVFNQLEKAASDRGVSVNLLVKKFMLDNLSQILDVPE